MVMDLSGVARLLLLYGQCFAMGRVFLAIGKQHVADFAGKPGNHYLLRLVEAAARTRDALTDTVCAELGRERSATLEAQIARALRNFETLALLERAR